MTVMDAMTQVKGCLQNEVIELHVPKNTLIKDVWLKMSDWARRQLYVKRKKETVEEKKDKEEKLNDKKNSGV